MGSQRGPAPWHEPCDPSRRRNPMRAPRLAALAVSLACLAGPAPLSAMGSWLLDDPAAAPPRAEAPRAEAPPRPLNLGDHQVDVLLLDGFSRTEVRQVWSNPNPEALEGTYSIPLPKNASLAEMEIHLGEAVLHGEVRTAEEAETLYQEEKQAGNDAGVARKDAYRRFRFAVSRIPPQVPVRVRMVYYQPLAVDSGVVRWVYPREPGGTREPGAAFWSDTVVEAGEVHLRARVRSTWPVADVRLPGLEATARTSRSGAGELEVTASGPSDRDLVVYYRLQDALPGRIEVVPYRRAGDGPGTFMAVLTPGVDLPTVDAAGADHVFVLDISGSMQGKLPRLILGVSRALESLTPQDRFRLLAFDTRVDDLTPQPLPGTPEGIAKGIALLETLRPRGGTDLFSALLAGLRAADPERATHLNLVTDGVANQGVLDAGRYRDLLRRTDVRVHAFLMGNEANWPLMETIARASGGHYQTVSSQDDLAGILALTRQKMTSEALHDVKVRFEGLEVFDLTEAPPRLHHGQQLVLMGKYRTPGVGTLRLEVRISGKPHVYRTALTLPAEDTATPELERLHAMARVEDLQRHRDEGDLTEAAAKAAVVRLGVEAQIVTDETSMVLLDDGRFQARGIERRNRARAAVEHVAQAARARAPVVNRRVDAARPAFSRPAPSVHRTSSSGGGTHRGGGAFDPLTGLLLLGLAGAARRRKPGQA